MSAHVFRIALVAVSITSPLLAGDLDPPGAPAPTPGPEPRIPITGPLPVTIGDSGSYYLTQSLTGVAGENGIVIEVDHVTLDLNGFELIGVNGSLDGIHAAGERINLTIHSGTVRDWGEDGVDCWSASKTELRGIQANSNQQDGLRLYQAGRIVDCRVTNNGDNGIDARGHNLIDGCIAQGNVNTGILAEAGCTVQDCVLVANFGSGIEVGEGSTVLRCTVRLATFAGIITGDACTVIECTVREGGAAGIVVGQGSTVQSCTVSQNTGSGIFAAGNNLIRDCSADGNGLDGIEVHSLSVVMNCRCAHNSGSPSPQAGIRVRGDGNRIDSNHVSHNGRGLIVLGSDNVVIRNTAQNNGSNYGDVGPGNDVGPIGNASTSTSPWANAEH